MIAITILHRGSELSIQWNLRVKDTLGPAILSLVGRLSFFQRLKMDCIYTFGGIVQVVPFSEGPSLEVPWTVVLKLA